MNLNITDPAIMFSGISLLFLAYTNRYLALASIVRSLNKGLRNQAQENSIRQIQNLNLRINLIKYMQVFGIISFLFCVFAMLSLFWGNQILGEVFFVMSLITMILSLLISLSEILESGESLRIELETTSAHDLKNK